MGSVSRESLSRGSLSGVSVQGVSVQGGGEVSVQEPLSKGSPYRDPPINRKRGSMHPTGILSCFVSIFELHDLDNELHCLDHHIAT